MSDSSVNPSGKNPDGQNLEANFSMLVMSIASSAAVSLGLAPDPTAKDASSSFKTDRNMAKFNIDLLLMLKDKTAGRLTADEDKLITAILADLQTRFLQLK